MSELKYFCNQDSIESNAIEQLIQYTKHEHIDKVCAFTDIHFCDEKALPVGVAFSSQDYFFPLITGKDIGCGVMFLKISKSDWIKPFNKSEHYRAFNLAHTKMTDDGLGGGNHFLSIEEDDNYVYILCHTGTRDRGIGLYQQCYELVQIFSDEYGKSVPFIHKSFVDDSFYKYYNDTLHFGYTRRKNFCIKTLLFLQVSNYIKSDKNNIPKNYLNTDFSKYEEKGNLFGVQYEIHDSVHNHIRFDDEKGIIHRKGSTELKNDEIVVIPLSMTRGSLLVKVMPHSEMAQDALYSCSHGAGRKLSRFDTMKYWKNSLKERERKEFREQFSEMLDRSGNFPSGYIQEFDFAYKNHSEIFTYQPYLKKITETKPIATVKFTEI